MSFETVIVGAGSSGAVIASRMTESSNHEVLLIEAGPDYPSDTTIPKDLRDGTRNSTHDHDWGFRHRPARGQSLFHLPRGKVVGGSSAVNTCIALRGHPYDYDEWASLGLPEWSFEKCLPAFKRLEHDEDFGGPWHGKSGPIRIRRHSPDELGPWQAAFLDACGELGFSRCPDSNAPNTEGYGPHAMNKIEGERMSAARGYLTPAVRARAGLTIRPDTLVHRVHVTNRRVTGLTLETQGRVYETSANRVILSAGSIGTPGILLRSGIGREEDVLRMGVELVSEVPAVGARILDHPGLAIFFRPRDWKDITFPLIQNVLRYTSDGSAFPGDMQLQAGSFVPLPWSFGGALPLVTLACSVGKSRSRGSLRYVDGNPRARPFIESRLLDDAGDRARAVEALTLAYRLSGTTAMRGLAKLFWPSRQIVTDPARLEAFLFRICDSGYHPCGTVPMGREGDPNAAVSERGRVRGVEGLWVADASIMPAIPSSNTNLASLMIGERFGQWFREGTA
jgi:choline dehydrogenase